MSLKRLVFEGEDIRYRTRKHWIVFLKGVFFLLLAFTIWSSKPWLQQKLYAFITSFRMRSWPRRAPSQ